MEKGLNSPYILHVEDDDGDAYLVNRALGQMGCNVRVERAKDGRECLGLLNAVSQGVLKKPKLVLLDLKLPLVSGFEILELVKGMPNMDNIPLAIFTSSEASKDRESAKRFPDVGYFVKPIDYGTFKDVVKEICEKYLNPLENQPKSPFGAFAL